MTRGRTAGAWAAALALLACGGPSPPAPAGTPPRAGRFGSLRDLVLFERPERGSGGALFVDRFEVTRGDWRAFAGDPAGRAAGADAVPTEGDAALPVSRVDLRQARAFARWRWLRLPRADEWAFAAVGDGRSRFPWGNREDPTRANTGELGLFEPTPVGTFESGRRGGGDQPYDLVGNVSEWTETVPARWCLDELDPGAALGSCRARVLRTPALSVWQGPGGLVPLAWAAAAGGAIVPREVAGADFQAPMAERFEVVLGGDQRSRTGLRLCATADELLLALAADPVEPSAADREQWRRFVARGRHRAVLAAAWAALLRAGRVPAGDRPLLRLLQQELAGGDDGPR